MLIAIVASESDLHVLLDLPIFPAARDWTWLALKSTVETAPYDAVSIPSLHTPNMAEALCSLTRSMAIVQALFYRDELTQLILITTRTHPSSTFPSISRLLPPSLPTSVTIPIPLSHTGLLHMMRTTKLFAQIHVHGYSTFGIAKEERYLCLLVYLSTHVFVTILRSGTRNSIKNGSNWSIKSTTLDPRSICTLASYSLTLIRSSCSSPRHPSPPFLILISLKLSSRYSISII